ncbi:hypothetical protein THAOC_36707 [Thalassiosira oceanica]|uniref:EF-hand domain-containing protein n=1 Tax=Thalassiosira oceanica TaxID=159749 RepID=K0R7S0_THAOC|nr:hypothetical protein THAOC_36707 [Thalassiosira oceanica]|eukprot:EJK44731.1 hypothetical protein THAOC_36707 [Thalassiosira oceanica]
MGLSNFVGLEHKELCELAFELFDIDRSGFLSISEVESMLSSTNLLPKNLVRKRAENFMLCAVVEMAICVHGVSPLPMGMGRADRHEGAGLQTWKGSKAA